MINIYELREAQVEKFKKDFESFITALDKSINKKLRNIETINDLSVIDNANLERVILIRQEISKAMLSYDDLVADTVKESAKIFDAIKINAKEVLSRSRLGGIDKLTVDAMLKTQNFIMIDIADKFEGEVGRALMANVMGGVQLEKAVELIGNTTEKFFNEALTNLRTAKNAFSQNAEYLVADSVGFGEDKDDIWEYLGAPLQANSHPECNWAVPKRYFTNDERLEFESGGGFPHTEPRYNCQHNFFMSNVTFEEAFVNAA